MRSMVEGACGYVRPFPKPPSVRPSACHLPVTGRIYSAHASSNVCAIA